MRNRTLALSALAVAAALAGCAEPSVADPRDKAQTANDDDCAVIAAVAREHYRFGPEETPPPLRLGEDDDGWKPDCDWARYGVSFPLIYGEAANGAAKDDRPEFRWVEFKRPRYDAEGATIDAGVMQGPRAGIGVTCRLRRGAAGWTLTACRDTWVS
ncbi:hypothetical protein SH203_02201 [Brevundimonas sp. SH203]|uniref:hypothetical protein n=1 Tax=Brevundimonas sp. SH203 TaxID=345167 RepID=UPI0009CE2390|nr:hypothetical protein [Brevundimonas sp. SH203]GAW41791.1 hypothetical protein SH203_02201 [Brevundimonas sp. SH203]